jgi:hypothetical protein
MLGTDRIEAEGLKMSVEWWVVLATLAGPVVAVQTQKWIERATETRRRRLHIFTALMANRATRLADDFVKALNLIDLEFLPRWWSERKDKEVINAWRALFGELNHGPGASADQAAILAWNGRCDDRVVDLLAAMSIALGFSFTKEELRRGIYHPQGNAEREQAQLAIPDGLRKILTGQASVPMAVTHFPVSEEAAKAQVELTRKAAAAYDENDEGG